jgi:hypothetical protein
MNSKLFKRKSQLIVGKIGSKGKLIDALRFSFEIEMNDSKETNKAVIRIYGISDETKGFIEEKDSSIFVNIGYANEDYSTIFIGNIVGFEDKQEGVDKFLEITCFDGYIPLSQRKLSLSFNSGATTQQIISKIIGELNLTKGDYSKIPNLVYEQGFSFVGSPASALNKILERIKYEWTIINNVLIITKNNSPQNETIMQFLSEKTGLIGSPEKFKYKPVKKKKDENKMTEGWKIKSLLLSSLQPKVLINLESKNASGIFLIKNVKFSGDTHGDNWNAEMEAVQK